MKLKCIKDSFEKTSGFFTKTTEIVKINGLTVGKVYNGHPVTTVSGHGNLGAGSIDSEIDFYIYDDNGEWDFYDTTYFVPAE